MARDFTDAELRQVAEFIARRYLEVERGLWGKQCLRRFLSPEAYDRQCDPAASRFGKGGVVRQTDLGRMSFQRPQADRAYVAIPARQQGDRWGALVIELRADARGVWRVTELTRAQDRNLARPQPAPEWKGPGDPDLALVELARTSVAARTARTAAAERYARARQDLARVAAEKPAAELVPGDLVNTGTLHDQQWTEIRHVAVDEASGDVDLGVADGTTLRVPAERGVSVLQVRNGDMDAARQAAAAAADRLAPAAAELARWDRQLDLLEHERDGLVDRRRARHVDEPDARQAPSSYVTRTLGLPPTDAAARQVWDAATGAIETYRERWGITRTDCALGPQPDAPEQRADRDTTVATLRELTARLGETGHDLSVARGHHLAAGHDQAGRAPFAAPTRDGQS